MSRPDLAARVRAYYTRHPDRVPPEFIVGVHGPRPWETSVDAGARRIEALRKWFPRARVDRAADLLQLDRLKPEWVLDDLEEQVYRAHYSSMKIAWSWQAAQNAVVAIAHLLGLVRARDVKDWTNPEGNARRDDAIYRKAKDALRAHVWPQETGLFKALDELEREPFYSQIPLRSGLLALGARMLLHQYACAIVDVMRRLHGNTPYTYELCLGRRPLDWREATLFKTTPRKLAAPEIEHALLVQKRAERVRKRVRARHLARTKNEANQGGLTETRH